MSAREELAAVLVGQTVRVQVVNVGTAAGFLRAESALHLADALLASPALARVITRARAEAWDEGFTRGFYDVLAGGDRDASESKAVNPYCTPTPEGAHSDSRP